MTDNIHESISFSLLERYIMQTPYFNRLHDVYQNSCVYLTFPSNRTKRFEHSIGTMKLASDLFYYSTSNMECDVQEYFLDELEKEFNKIRLSLINSNKPIIEFDDIILNNIDYCNRRDQLKKENFLKLLNNINNLFGNNFLINYTPSTINNSFHIFLYQCLLQSLRISSMLHDIGHPPYSHIIEKALSDLYSEICGIEESKRTKRQVKFIEILQNYRSTTSSFYNKINSEMFLKKNKETRIETNIHFHESVSLKMTWQILQLVFKNYFDDYAKNKTNIVYIIYCISIFEFTFAILNEKSDFWRSIHSIISSTVDADRLDYVVRDTSNSGVSWGTIPYKRLIQTAKFVLNSKIDTDSYLSVAFAEKNINIIDDFLNMRLKIFSEINYHHHNAKISLFYKESVKILARKYLSNSCTIDQESDFFTDISGLWLALDNMLSSKYQIINAIQWNDSWLNSILYNALIECMSNEMDDIGEEDEETKRLSDFLKEIFLSTKAYFSLIKRKSDIKDIEMTIGQNLESLIQKISDNKAVADNEATLKTLDLYSDSLKSINLEILKKLLGKENIFYSACLEVLEDYSSIVEHYIVEDADYGLGIKELKVYKPNGKIYNFFDISSITDYLTIRKNSFPTFFVFIKFKKTISNEDLTEIRNRIGLHIAKKVEERCNEIIHFTI